MMQLTRRSVLAAATVLPTVAALPARAQARWEARAPIPWPTQEVYGCAWQGAAVIAGGMAPAGGQTNALARVGRYDAAADRWSELPPLPYARHHPSLAAEGDQLFVLGGYRIVEAGAWSAVRDVLLFSDSRWRPLAPLPQAQTETVALALGGQIHLMTGRSPRGQANAAFGDHADGNLHQVYDVRDNRWRSARPSVKARNSAAGGVIDGKLYLAAGRTFGGGGNMGDLERYDPATDQWTALKPMPLGAGGCAGAVLGGKLYVFGGEGGPRDNGFGGVIPNCWSYDVARDEWSAEAPMKTPRHGLAGMEIGGRILAIGGGTRPSGGAVSAVVEALVP